jgi:acetylornithine/N-succinyldiaminopimelate aminotransferase
MTTPALLPTYQAFPFAIAKARGDQLFAEDGSIWWDYYGGHCVASTGHSHPSIVQAICAQAEKILFYSTAGELKLRAQAAQALIDFADGVAHSAFFCNSGAEANENALKIARLITGRSKVASVSGGWHGRSLACLSVTDDVKITKPYESWLIASQRIGFNDLVAVEAIDLSDTAAVIVEPIQSLSGIRVCTAEFLTALAARCRAAGTVLIFDEIQTGIGRLGRPFAANGSHAKPDMITSAKGIASGVPMAAVLMTDSVAKLIKPGDLGSTFGAGPLAMAAMQATLDVIQREALMARALHCERYIRDAALDRYLILGQGLLLGISPHQSLKASASALKQHLYDARILAGGSQNPEVLRLMPPLNLSDAALVALQLALSQFGNTP